MVAKTSILIVVVSLNWAGYISYYYTSTTWMGECPVCVLLQLITAINRYQLYIDDILEDDVDSFGNEWRLDLFTNTESPRLVLGAADDQEGLPYFRGCMKNLAIQFRSVSFIYSHVYVCMITEL